MTTTGNSNPDVDIRELVNTEDEDRLVDLEPQDFGLDEGERLSVDLDQTFTGLAVCDSSRSLLLSEALHTLSRSHAGQYGLS